jgi:tetratricopeptide (TPR) repeat protein
MIILQIKESMRRKKFDEALELIEQIPENFRTSEIFLLKGICIQLSENLKFNLNEAEYSFKKAIELDSNNIEAKIELGWFYFNVLDQSKEADKEFGDALEIIKSKLSEHLF